MGGDLVIQTNPVMTNVAGLENLTSIGGDLTIQSNQALNSLAGLDNIDASSINNLTIYSNTSLSIVSRNSYVLSLDTFNEAAPEGMRNV